MKSTGSSIWTGSVMSWFRKTKCVVPDVVDVLERPGVQVVDADHPVPLGEQVLAEMGPQESSSSGDDGGGHRRRI